jgi:hypothetical protein
MSKLSMRRFLPVIALPVLLLFAAPSALGTPLSFTEKFHAAHLERDNGLHQKADIVSGRKADSKSGKKTDSKSNRRGKGKSHKKAASKSAATRTAAALGATPIPTTILLGNSAVQSRQGYLSAERSAAFRFRAEAAGTTGAARIYIAPSNAASIVIVGIYSNANNQPGSLLSVGSLVSPTAGAWNSVALSASSIALGQSYWLAILGEGGTLRYSASLRGFCVSATSAQADLGGLPATWSSGRGRESCPISAYVTAAESILTPPVETPPVETPPVETPPVKTPPVETPPVKTPPAPPVETPPVETPPVETPPVETPPVETPPVETPPVETPPVETPAPAPTNTVLPSVSGAATEGDTLTATSGSWTGDPTGYVYQWQDCNTSGAGCTDVGGATASTRQLSASDVGHAVRVVVTATNAGGSTSANSAASATVVALPPPPPPAPTNTAMPAISGTPAEGQVLSTTNGTWTSDPTSYTYQWRDCSRSGHSCTNVSGATASTYRLTAGDVEHTVRVMVTAANAGGSTSMSSPATTAVTAPPAAAPANTALPTIAGTAIEGQTLSATNGTWEGNPTSYTYQWQDCNTSGTGCTAIAGATAGTRVLSSGDVGHTLRIVVKATNTSATGEATSAATAAVAAEQTGGGTPEGCFANPESCGYPGPNNTGVANCAALKASGGKTITKSETVEGLDISGEVVIDASNVKLNDDCIEVNGNEEQGSAAVILDNGASNFAISNSTIRGKNTTSQSIEEALRNNYSNAGATATKDRLENCAECLHQTWSISESYVNANGEQKADESGLAHAEDWWFDNGTVSANDDTLLNPSKQTAVIFAESGGGSCQNHETVTNSLLAGGGFMFYFCAHSSGAGSSSIDIKNNRFARMVCTKKEISNFEGRGGFGCGPEGSYFSYGEGSGGYFPRGGFFGLVYEGEGIYNKGAGWEGNYWDNNLASVEAP